MALLDTIGAFANAVFALLAIIFSIVLMVKDVKFQPELAKTALGKTLAWGARSGLAVMVVMSAWYVLDILLMKGHNINLIRECGIGLSITLIFSRMVHKAFVNQHEYRNQVFSYIAEKSLNPKKRHVVWSHLGYAALISTVAGLFLLGPKLEQKLLPVMSQIEYSNVVRRDAAAVCWTFSYDKVREAKPEYIIYLVRESDGKQFDTTLYRNRPDGTTPFSVENTSVGSHVNTDLCADIPINLANAPDLKLVGEVKYTTSFPWAFYQKVPTLDIPAYKRN